MSNQIQTIQFHNQSLVTFAQNGTYYTAMKPICENIGLDWKAQYSRIKRDDVLSSTMVMMTIVAEDGKNREMVCLPIQYLNGWLFGIDIKRVKPEIRETLITYKKECYQVLFNYWNKGKAERKTTTDERTGLRQAVSALVSKRGLMYPEAYNLIHQRFNVEHIDQLTSEQIPMAVEYVQKIYLEGELIDTPIEKKYSLELTEDEIQTLTWAWFAFLRGVHTFQTIYEPLERLGSRYSGMVYGQAYEYRNLVRQAHKVISKISHDFRYDEQSSWRVLKHVRDFDPTFKQSIL